MPAPSVPYRGRFAPSPTGPLHLGSLVAALGSWLLARRAGGEWLVRIEDIDPPREIAGAATGQVETLRAFGLESDAPVVRQSERSDLYAAALASLMANGDAFTCLCSRADLQATGGLHLACVPSPSGKVHAYRLRTPARSVAFTDLIRGPVAQQLHREVGDVVLKRADGWWAYQLAVVVDDARQGVTDVVRGADLLDSTPRQIHLQRCLSLPTPRYAHLPLLLDGQGGKLGKSIASLPIEADDPAPALRAAYGLLGQPAPALGRGNGVRLLQRALEHFDPARIPAHDVALPAGLEPAS
jgi:glutamyl-Q tRNA(Asp) synthetase